MPQTTSGEGYRDYSEPRFYECETDAQVALIRNPVDKAWALVAADDGSTDLTVWKFDLASVAMVSATVLVPLNAAYAVSGRWISITVSSGGGGGTVSALAGSGSPEGVTTGTRGYTYWDYTNQILYVKNTAGSGNTGWLAVVTF